MIELNDSNRSLLQELINEGFNVSFEKWKNAHMGVFTQNNTVTVSYNEHHVGLAAIAHELLHVKMKSYKYISANYLKLAFTNKDFFYSVFDDKLCEHIGNLMDHAKMYPLFLKMGYAPEEFLNNGNSKLVDLEEIKKIRIKRWSGVSAKDVNLFIGHLFAILADHLDNDYTVELQILKDREPNLFNIITKFWANWLNFDLTSIDSMYNSDIQLLDNFLDDLEDWEKEKRIKRYA